MSDQAKIIYAALEETDKFKLNRTNQIFNLHPTELNIMK